MRFELKLNTIRKMGFELKLSPIRKKALELKLKPKVWLRIFTWKGRFIDLSYFCQPIEAAAHTPFF